MLGARRTFKVKRKRMKNKLKFKKASLNATDLIKGEDGEEWADCLYFISQITIIYRHNTTRGVPLTWLVTQIRDALRDVPKKLLPKRQFLIGCLVCSY